MNTKLNFNNFNGMRVFPEKNVETKAIYFFGSENDKKRSTSYIWPHLFETFIWLRSFIQIRSEFHHCFHAADSSMQFHFDVHCSLYTYTLYNWMRKYSMTPCPSKWKVLIIFIAFYSKHCSVKTFFVFSIEVHTMMNGVR